VTGGLVVRIGNASGFYGDRPSAFRELLEAGGVDVLTGDYLAELTMLILAHDGVVYHTYSAYAHGCDALWSMWQWLDRAPFGRNEGDMSWFHRHDEYHQNALV
jgi:predicted dithiol-disulfide oxidoreductase (DUF899 family)